MFALVVGCGEPQPVRSPAPPAAVVNVAPRIATSESNSDLSLGNGIRFDDVGLTWERNRSVGQRLPVRWFVQAEYNSSFSSVTVGDRLVYVDLTIDGGVEALGQQAGPLWVENH